MHHITHLCVLDAAADPQRGKESACDDEEQYSLLNPRDSYSANLTAAGLLSGSFQRGQLSQAAVCAYFARGHAMRVVSPQLSQWEVDARRANDKWDWTPPPPPQANELLTISTQLTYNSLALVEVRWREMVVEMSPGHSDGAEMRLTDALLSGGCGGPSHTCPLLKGLAVYRVTAQHKV